MFLEYHGDEARLPGICVDAKGRTVLFDAPYGSHGNLVQG